MSYLLGNLMAGIGLVGIFCLTGWLLDRRWLGGDEPRPFATAERFGLGAASWMGLVFLLMATHLWSRPTLGLLILLTLLLAWRLRRALATGHPNQAAAAEGYDWPGVWLAVGLGFLLVALWLQNQWPIIAWDADAYHLTVPRLYSEEGGFRRIPFNVYSNWPLNLQMLYALALLARSYLVAKLLHFAFGLATVLLIYRVVSLVSRPWAGWLGGALYLLNPVVLDEIRVAYVDLAYAFFLLLAFLLLHRALEGSADAARNLLLAGVFGGVAAGCKPTGILGALCLILLYLVVTRRRREALGSVATGLLRLGLPLGLLLVPWMLKSWALTGNPAYPFLYGLFGGPEWSVELGRQLRAWQQGMGMGRSWLDYLLLPVRVVLLGDRGYETFDGRILRLWVILIPLGLVSIRRRPLVGRCLGFAGLYFLSWAFTSQQMRFLIPVLPFLAVAGALALHDAVALLPRAAAPLAPWVASLSMLAMLTFAGVSLVPQSWQMLRQYLHLGAEVQQTVVHPVFDFIDSELPADAKLMFLNTNHGFFCSREFVADSFFEASQINALFLEAGDREGIARVLADLGITHLLIENRDRYVPWPQSLFEFLNDSDLVRRIYRSPDGVYDVVEIIASPTSTAG